MASWDMIKEERVVLVDALGALPKAAWDSPSLCTGWTVRDVIAHITATAYMTPPRFMLKFTGSRFNFPAMSGKDIKRLTSQNNDEQLLDLLRARIDARTAPP